MRSLWETVSSPVMMRRLNGWFTLIWIVMVPISYFAGWLDSVVYVSALSLWALVSGHWAAWEAARVEARQADDDDVAEVRRVVEQLRADLGFGPEPAPLREGETAGDQPRVVLPSMRMRTD